MLEREVVEAFGATLGPDHPDALAAAANRAITLRAMERVAEAEALRATLLEVLERKLGAEHGNRRALVGWRRLDFDLEPQPT